MFSKLLTSVMSQTARHAKAELPVIRGASYAGNRNYLSYWVHRAKPSRDIFTARRSQKINFRPSDYAYGRSNDSSLDTLSLSSEQTTSSGKLRKRRTPTPSLQKPQTNFDEMVEQVGANIRNDKINSLTEYLMREAQERPTRYYATWNWAHKKAENEASRRQSIPVTASKPFFDSPRQSMTPSSYSSGISTPKNHGAWNGTIALPATFQIPMPIPYHQRYGQPRLLRVRATMPVSTNGWGSPAHFPLTPKVTMPVPFNKRYTQDHSLTTTSNTPTNTREWGHPVTSPSTPVIYKAYHPRYAQNQSLGNAGSENSLYSIHTDMPNSRRHRKLQKAQDHLEKRRMSRLSMSLSDESNTSLASDSTGSTTPTVSYWLNEDGTPVFQFPKKHKRSSYSSAIETIREPVEMDSTPALKKSKSWPGSPVTSTPSQKTSQKNIFDIPRTSIWSEHSAPTSEETLPPPVQQRSSRKLIKKKMAEMTPVSDKENPLGPLATL